jgi:hypothetical protein
MGRQLIKALEKHQENEVNCKKKEFQPQAHFQCEALLSISKDNVSRRLTSSAERSLPFTK